MVYLQRLAIQNTFTQNFIPTLIQVNAHSFVEETDTDIRDRARELLCNQYIHFIGSDAHRMDYRPPRIVVGVQYIFENSNAEYAAQIINGNLSLLLEG